MSAGVNKVILVGNLGSDPELRNTSGGTSVCEFRLATNESWKGKDGQTQDRTEWHRIVVWGRLGENCGKYLSKGRPVYLEGRLQTRSWEDKEGNKRYTTEVRAQRFQMLGSRQDDRVPAASAASAPQTATAEPEPGYADDDIPF